MKSILRGSKAWEFLLHVFSLSMAIWRAPSCALCSVFVYVFVVLCVCSNVCLYVFMSLSSGFLCCVCAQCERQMSRKKWIEFLILLHLGFICDLFPQGVIYGHLDEVMQVIGLQSAHQNLEITFCFSFEGCTWIYFLIWFYLKFCMICVLCAQDSKMPKFPNRNIEVKHLFEVCKQLKFKEPIKNCGMRCLPNLFFLTHGPSRTIYFLVCSFFIEFDAISVISSIPLIRVNYDAN